MLRLFANEASCKNIKKYSKFKKNIKKFIFVLINFFLIIIYYLSEN